jgi:Cof subfamily protein (haloacid dehalogenase superfamily)
MMDFSPVKLVAADMDGTLLNSKHELSEDFYSIFEKLALKNILFCAASGRQYHNILNQFKQFQDKIIFIAENGSYVVYKGEELLVQAMDKQVARQLLLESKQIKDVNIILCGRKTAYIENTSTEFVNRLNLYYDKVQVVDDLLHIDDDDFLKIALCDLQGSENNSYRFFKGKQDRLQVKISGNIWLDLSHKLANKGRALQYVQQRFGVTSLQTMAFGDFLNDIEMLQEATFSFAMANAHEEVKKVARYHAGTNDEDGVLTVLRDLIKP